MTATGNQYSPSPFFCEILYFQRKTFSLILILCHVLGISESSWCVLVIELGVQSGRTARGCPCRGRAKRGGWTAQKGLHSCWVPLASRGLASGSAAAPETGVAEVCPLLSAGRLPWGSVATTHPLPPRAQCCQILARFLRLCQPFKWFL